MYIKIKEINQSIETLLEHFPNPAYIKDTNHHILWMNKSCQKFWEADTPNYITDYDIIGGKQITLLQEKDAMLFLADQQEYQNLPKSATIRLKDQADRVLILKRWIIRQTDQCFIACTFEKFYKDQQTSNTPDQFIESLIEQKKRESEEKIIINSIPARFYFKDAQNRILRVNKAVADFVGLSIEEIEGRHTREIFPDYAENYYKEDLEIMRTGIPVYDKVDQFIKDGVEKWTRTDKLPVINNEGKITGLIIFARDVTEYYNIQRALVASEAKYRTLFEHAFDGIIIVNLHTQQTVSCNQKLLQKLQISEKTVLENGLLGISTPNQANGKSTAYYLKEVIQEGILSGRVQCDWDLILPDNGIMHTELSGIALPAPNQHLLVIVFRDITAQKNAEMEQAQFVKTLEAKNNELEQYIRSYVQMENFAYIASHDIREPLRTISSFVQLLSRKYEHLFDQNGKEYLQYIINATSNLNKLIEDLLNYSRVNAEEHIINPIQLNDLLIMVIQSLKRVIDEKNATIELINLPETIKGNNTKLRQLFQNLINNGIKFHRQDINPQIKINCFEEAFHWRFEIRDNGIGIPQKHHQNIFQLFKKLHGKNDYQGSGIGLALCKRIVEQHGGTIRVQSVEGEGTIFIFTLSKEGIKL